MTIDTTVDFVTHDPKSDEFVLYIVENGPWPTSDSEWRKCLKRIQDHILDVVDSAVDGGVAKKVPDSTGKALRIQIDAPDGTPAQLEEIVAAVRRYLATDEEYRTAIGESPFIKALRLVTGKELGRFRETSADGKT